VTGHVRVIYFWRDLVVEAYRGKEEETGCLRMQFPRFFSEMDVTFASRPVMPYCESPFN
jgi:hypothetical protein